MDRESIIELQKLDCNCNDCIHLHRDLEKKKKYDDLHPDQKKASWRTQYGVCKLAGHKLSFIPNTLQLHTQGCFTHRRES